MDKKIIIILSIILVVVIAIVLYFLLPSSPKVLNSCPIGPKICKDGSKSYPVMPDCKHTCAEDNITISEEACTSSGGVVSTSSCCQSSSDFPNTCLIGACGCSPDNSKETKTCACPEGSCFDGTGCTAPTTE